MSGRNHWQFTTKIGIFSYLIVIINEFVIKII